MRNEWPVNKQSATDQISLGHRAPPATIETVVAVVAHRVVTVLQHSKRFRRVRHCRMPRPVTAISVLRTHHAVKAVTFPNLPVPDSFRRLTPPTVPAQ